MVSNIAMQNFSVGVSMGTRQFKCKVICPTKDDFAKQYHQYAPFAMGEGRELFDLIIRSANFIRMAIVRDLGFAALFGGAEPCCNLAQMQSKPLTPYGKQFIGVVVCCLVENNGYKKTGLKKSIGYLEFSRCYVLSWIICSRMLKHNEE